MKKIALTRGLSAKVSDKDFSKVKPLNWYACSSGSNFYARRTVTVEGKHTKQYLHRFILGEKLGLEVDHKNGNTLDCQRSNLRYATHTQNIRNQKRRKNNTSGYKGVKLVESGKWCAGIHALGRCISLGVHKTPRQAAIVYDEAARKYYGEFARTNFGAK